MIPTKSVFTIFHPEHFYRSTFAVATHLMEPVCFLFAVAIPDATHLIGRVPVSIERFISFITVEMCFRLVR